MIVSGLTRQVLVAVAFVFLVVMNVISSVPSSPIGRSNAEISDDYHTPFTPAGFTFAVWGVIYLFQAIFVVFQFFPSNRNNQKLDALAPYVIAMYLLNVSWLVIFQTEKAFTISEIIIAIYLAIVFFAYRDVAKVGLHTKFSREVFLVNAAFSTQLAWLVAANCASLCLTLKFYGWNVPTDFAAGLVFLVGCLATFVSLTRADVAYAAVSLWALIGIISENRAMNPESRKLVPVAILVIVSSLLALAIGLFQWYKTPVPTSAMLADKELLS